MFGYELTVHSSDGRRRNIRTTSELATPHLVVAEVLDIASGLVQYVMDVPHPIGASTYTYGIRVYPIENDTTHRNPDSGFCWVVTLREVPNERQ